MDFNGEVSGQHLQWLFTGLFAVLFASILFFRKRKKLNRLIVLAIFAFLTFGLAALLSSIPLFFIRDGQILLYVGYVSNTALYLAFLLSSLLMLDIAPTFLEGPLKAFRAIYLALLPFIYTYTMYVHFSRSHWREWRVQISCHSITGNWRIFHEPIAIHSWWTTGI